MLPLKQLPTFASFLASFRRAKAQQLRRENYVFVSEKFLSATKRSFCFNGENSFQSVTVY